VLNRSIDNACESWAIARELRQRKDALRLVTDRETFRGLFNDATRDLTDEQAIKRLGSHLLGVHLRVDRVVYGEVLDNENMVIGHSYVDAAQLIEGTHKLQDYSPKLLATLRSGKNIMVSDIRSDDSYSVSEKAAYAAMGIVANLGIPILKNGQLFAVLGIHQNTSRHWFS
jgi:GAF domain-containing protein